LVRLQPKSPWLSHKYFRALNTGSRSGHVHDGVVRRAGAWRGVRGGTAVTAAVRHIQYIDSAFKRMGFIGRHHGRCSLFLVPRPAASLYLVFSYSPQFAVRCSREPRAETQHTAHITTTQHATQRSKQQ
jgi:hypothetical protein